VALYNGTAGGAVTMDYAYVVFGLCVLYVVAKLHLGQWTASESLGLAHLASLLFTAAKTLSQFAEG